MTTDSTPSDTDPGRDIDHSASLIPQDRTPGVYSYFLGLSISEWVAVVVPTVAVGWGISHVPLPPIIALAIVMVAFGGCYYTVLQLDAHLTPAELVARTARYYGRRVQWWRAERIPRRANGVVESVGDQALRRRDGALVGAVAVDPQNSQIPTEHLLRQCQDWATGINAVLARGAGGDGIPFQVLVQQTDYDPRELRGLASAGHPLADAQVDHYIEAFAASGLMDRRVLLVTTAEADASGGWRRWLPRWDADDSGASEAQQRRLDRRVDALADAARQAVGSAAVRRCDATELSRRLSETAVGFRYERADAATQRLRTRAERPDRVCVEDRVCATLLLTRWPLTPTPGALGPLLRQPGVEYSLSLHAHPTDFEAKQSALQDEEEEMQGMARIRAEYGGGDAADASRVAQLKADLRQRMQDRDLDVLETSATLTVWATDADRLERVVAGVQRTATDAGYTATRLRHRQWDGYLTTLPLGWDRLRDRCRFETAVDTPSDALGNLWPFGGGVRTDETGSIHGLTKPATGEVPPTGVLAVDPERLTTPHRFVIGQSGAGKTFHEGMTLITDHLRAAADGRERTTVIMDVAGGYDGVIDALDGERVVVGETPLNPFAISPGEADTRGMKVDLLATAFMSYIRRSVESVPAVETTLKTAIRTTYDRAGITPDPATHDRDAPTMATFFDVLTDMMEHPGDYAVTESDSEADALQDDVSVILKHLRAFGPDGEYAYLTADAGGLTAAFDNDVVLLDLSRLETRGEAQRALLMTLVTSHAFEYAKRSAGRVRLVIDEAHILFTDAGQAEQLETVVRAGRNYDLAVDLLTQAGEDMLASETSVIADQCSLAVYHDMGESDLESLQTFGLGAHGRELLGDGLSAGDTDGSETSEAVIDIEGSVYLTEVSAADDLQRVLETGDYTDDGQPIAGARPSAVYRLRDDAVADGGGEDA